MTGGTISGAGMFDPHFGITTIASTTEAVVSVTNWNMGNSGQNNTLNVGAGTVAGGIDLLVSSVIGGGYSITKTGAGVMALTGADTYTGTTTISAGTLQLGNGGAAGTLAAASTITDNGTLAFKETANLTQGTNFSTGAISGAGAIIQSGTDVVTLNAANTFTGNVTVNSGTLAANYNAAAVTATALGNVTSGTRSITVNNGGALWFEGSGSDLGSSTSTPGIAMVINAGGKVVSTAGADALGPSLTLSGGSLMALTGAGSNANNQAFSFGGNATATVTANGAAESYIALPAGVTAVAGSNGFNLAPTTTFNVTGTGGLLVSMALANQASTGAAASLAKTGTGLLNLDANNTYTGGTTVSAGSLELSIGGGTGTLAPGSTVTVQNGATLMGNAQDPLGYNNTTGVTGAVILTIQSGGQFVETGAVHASITTLNMTGGTIGSTGPGNGGGNIAVNGVWNVTSDTFGNPALIDATAIGMNGGSFNVSRGPGAVDMLITSVITSLNNDGDGMTKSGAGILELTGLNTYTGGTTVQGGILQLGSAAATLGPSSGALTLSGGTLDLHGYNPTVGALFGTTGAIDNLTSTASTVTIGSGGANGTFSATIQNSVGTLSLLKVGTGTQVLGGTNTYTGTTNVSAGILQFAQPAALYDSATGNWTAANITAGSLATLAVNVNNAGGFTPSIAGILLTNLTGTNSGLLKGAAFGIDTTNATAPVVFSSLIQDSAAGSVGLTKLGAGTLQVTNPANSYTGPTTVVNGRLMLFGANTTTSTAPGLVTVSNSTSGGLSILSLLNHDALGSGNTIAPWPPSA